MWFKSSLAGIGAAGSCSILIAAALGAEVQVAGETFSQTAERWGIWAAVCISLMLVAVVGLVTLVKYVIGTQAAVIDDNTLSHLHIARVFSTRPCIRDSDAIVDLKGIEDDVGPIGDTGRRVLARRKARQLKVGEGK